MWHKQDNEEERFYVIRDNFTMEFRDKKIEINEHEFLIVAKGVEHRPTAESEVRLCCLSMLPL
ncbi:hypothetical protein FC093_09845 [Ilyomonas limi]|uniref:Cupin domain-containing protein n=1 Tax=Ilyomonas limi TaxID=2575867 RepID=A0A4U3L3V0_9BACT|nr:hypothetical protein [Ilyomonas limi]TKK68984.1 hypothetical protein FC093_09845 [Ilyomonas limi]